MKRIALLGLACFVLVGCGDNSGGKVTNDYLVGEWDCVLKQYMSKYDYDSEKYSDYVETDNISIIQSYKIVNGILFEKLPDQEAKEFDLDKFYNNLKAKYKTHYEEHDMSRSLVKNSNDKFTFENESFSTLQTNQIEPMKFKTKTLRVCTRIK